MDPHRPARRRDRRLRRPARPAGARHRRPSTRSPTCRYELIADEPGDRPARRQRRGRRLDADCSGWNWPPDGGGRPPPSRVTSTARSPPPATPGRTARHGGPGPALRRVRRRPGGSPLTNTLPIRRLGLLKAEPGGAHHLSVAWVLLPSLEVVAGRPDLHRAGRRPDALRERDVQRRPRRRRRRLRASTTRGWPTGLPASAGGRKGRQAPGAAPGRGPASATQASE